MTRNLTPGTVRVPRQPCVHKYIAKWHISKTVKSNEMEDTLPTGATEPCLNAGEESSSGDVPLYLSKGKGLGQVLQYLLKNERLPANLPEDVCRRQRKYQII